MEVDSDSVICFSPLELTLLALAVVVDSVLFLILVERINRPNMATGYSQSPWQPGSACGGILPCLDSAIGLAFVDRFGSSQYDRDGDNLLVIPCAMFHAAVRLNHTGYVLQPAWDWRYGFCYLPIVMLAFGLQSILSCDDRSLGSALLPSSFPT